MKVEYSRIDGHAFIYITYRYDTIFNVVRFLHLFPVNKQTKRHVFAALLWRIFLYHEGPFSLDTTPNELLP